ncbi:tetraacyldisaccharide 4'-kinase [Luteibacter sp. Sphag1AF]|uniref:tetraacyldisaccharide 4'-kinase n=1 Tax=Luteibacter sp. Sphag1AF TaxID=2587031 RepID=UPI0017FA3AA9|nr:tetraacyldisaccharide 4'-kinase [Luteibacter sp. Sphag1AF]MBB3228378.1 tetraacyldisaccharide 4'-kinase [Luteibacter sp. Sphag1AF]
MADALQRRWYDGRQPPLWTLPLEALYRRTVTRKEERFRRDPSLAVRLAVPVVVVGNITIGGTGKTPLIIALARALVERGYRPGVVSRGYGGSERGPALLDAQSSAATVGDEPCLIFQSGVPVAIGRQRPEAARLLINEGCDVVLADDGLQHYRLARDVEICVIDGERRFGNARLLPAGPLREPLSRLDRVDFIVNNGGRLVDDEIPMTLRGGFAINMADPEQVLPLSDFTERPVHAVAGIGNPGRFFRSLRDQGVDVRDHAFADHHAFSASDLTFDDGCPVLMTDKDAVKCRAFARPHWWRVPVQAVLDEAFFDAVASRVAGARRG